MTSTFKSLLSRLFGGGDEAAPSGDAAAAVEYKGYRIRPAPYKAQGHYQTAGVIEKEFPSGVKEHRFVRADTHSSLDDAVAFAISKAKQIIDERGDKLFGPD